MKLRKSAKVVRARAALLTDDRFGEPVALGGRSASKLPAAAGVYVVTSSADARPVYAGEASNLRERLQNQFGPKTRAAWKLWSDTLSAKFFPTSCSSTDRLAYQWRLVAREKPVLNLRDIKAV